jgi:serine acetyltransferase
LIKVVNDFRWAKCPLCYSQHINELGEISYRTPIMFSTHSISLKNTPELNTCTNCGSWFTQNIINKNTAFEMYSQIEIGNECLLGANVIIADTDFHSLNPNRRRFNNNPKEIAAMPIIIEDNVFIGAGSIILKDVRIGKNSVIGACSVVTKDVPQGVVVAGNPAKILRKI